MYTRLCCNNNNNCVVIIIIIIMPPPPQLKHQELSRILQMGDRLVGSHHPGADMMRARGIEMRGLWDILSSVLAERRALLALSLDFHTKQDKVGGTLVSRFFHRMCM